MTIQDIALFKSYIESNTLREIFIRHYRKSISFASNPLSIEEFLSKVEPENVIKDGIKNFSTNSNYGYDFWVNANENWLVFLAQGRKRHSYTDYHKLMELDGMFKVLRENWDAVKSWLYEDLDVALKRLGLKEAEEVEEEEVEEDTNPDEDFSGVPEYEDDLEFFDLSAGSRIRSTRLKSDEVSLNFRNKGYKLSFNQEITKKLQQKGYKYVRLARNKQGDIVLQLHKQESGDPTPVNLTYSHTAKGSSVNAGINSKDLCNKLKVLLNLTGDYFVLHIEELYMDFDKANYKITK